MRKTRSLTASFLPTAAALVATLAPALAVAAPPMQRPNRVTANPVSTTNKVLVAVPTDRLSEYDYLYVVSRGDREASGIPVAVDGATPFNSTLVLMNAPLLDARDGFWGENFLRAERGSGFETASLGSTAPEGNQELGAEVDSLREALSKPIRVFATGGAPFQALPARLQQDPWALLNAGRYRDAGPVFAASEAGPARDAGMALSAALLGRLDAAETLLGQMDVSTLPVPLPVGSALAARVQSLATEMYPDTAAGEALLALATAAGSAPAAPAGSSIEK